MIGHPKGIKRLRDKKHLSAVREGGCCICGNPAADAHHLRMVGHSRGLSVKNGDNWVIPLCRMHHDELHMFGDEKTFLDLHGVDAAQLAVNLWRKTNEERQEKKTASNRPTDGRDPDSNQEP